MPSEVRVSVTMTAFNQERFIAEAIESVLAQRTGFAFELVVGEDASTDRTPEIVAAFAAAHPERVRAIHRERNLGMMQNFRETVAECRGEYVALLEGDDIWTNPGKLQAQVDALEAHPGWTACFHRARTFHDEGSWEEVLSPASPPGEVVTMEDLIRSNPISTCTAMYRRALQPRMPDWFDGLPVGDWPLWILLAARGPIGYLDAVMSANRFHSGSHWGSRSFWDRTRHAIDTLVAVSAHLDAETGPLFADSVGRHIWTAVRNDPGDGSAREERAAITRVLRAQGGPWGLSAARRALLLAALSAPRLASFPPRLMNAVRRRLAAGRGFG